MKLLFPSIIVSGMVIFTTESTLLSPAQAQTTIPATLQLHHLTPPQHIPLTQANNTYHSNDTHPQPRHPFLHAIAKFFGLNHTTTSHTTNSYNTSTYHHSGIISGLFHGITNAINGITHLINNGISGITHLINNGITHIANSVKATATLFGAFNYVTGVTLERAIRDMLNGDNKVPAPLMPSAEVLADAAGKIPVILVPGGFSNSQTVLPYYNTFEKAGIPTYAATLGNGPRDLISILDPKVGGTDYVDTSAHELSDFIDQVQKQTGSPKVDLVAISQGGLIARDYLVHDQKDNIESVANMGGAEHGSTINGLSQALSAAPKFIQRAWKAMVSAIDGPSTVDLLNTSDIVHELNQYPDTKPGINYLDISSNNDTFVSPGEQAGFLTAGPGAKVTNIEVHTIPGVPANFNHLQFATMQPVIDKAVEYIQANGQFGTGISGVTRTNSPITTVNTPEQSQHTTVTPPSVSLLG